MRLFTWTCFVLTAAAAMTCCAGCSHRGHVIHAAEFPARMNSLPGQIPGASVQTAARDASEVLKRVVSAYKKPNALEFTTSTDQEITGDQRIQSHQECDVTYTKNPGKLAVISIDQVSGSTKQIADGESFYSFSGLTNSYTRQKCSGDLKRIARLIHKDSPQLLSVSSYLMGNDKPFGLGDAVISGRENLDGQNCIVIDGKFTTAFMEDISKRTGNAGVYRSSNGNARIWIDEHTYFPHRLEVKLLWNESTRNDKAKNVTMNFREVTRGVVLNPRIPAGRFKFEAPPGSKEIFAADKGQVEVQ